MITPPRWRETGVDVETVDDEYFPVIRSRTFLSKHIQLFAYDPFPIIKALRRHRPHVIDMDHEPYSIPCAEIIQLRNIFAPDARIVMQTAQNILKKYPFPFSLLEKRALKQVSAAYMCSETVRDVLESKGFEKPIFNAPFGIDRKLFYPGHGNRSEIPTIGFVGRLIKGKGLLTLIESLALLKSKEWNLIVVGDGERKKDAIDLIKVQRLKNRVHFAGAVAYEETPKHFRSFDVLAVPTRTTDKIREQFGRVIIEAMACGVPVVGSTCGAIPEVIADTGLIFKEGDPIDLSKKIESLLEDGARRRNLGDAAYERATSKYTWECAAEQIHKAYLAAVAGGQHER